MKRLLVLCSMIAVSIGLTGCATTRVPLVDAADRGDLNTVKTLLDNGADVNQRGGNTAMLFSGTALMHASDKGRTDVVKLLLARGADANARDGIGVTPLVHAAQNGHSEIVELLLDHGVPAEGALKYFEARIVQCSAFPPYPPGVTSSQTGIQTIKAAQASVPARLNRLGWDYVTKGEYDKAIDVFKQGISQYPTFVGNFAGLSVSHDALKQYDEAITAAKRAVELAPKDPYVYMHLGTAYWHKKQYDEAEKALKTAVENDPKDASVTARLGSFYRTLYRFDDALPVLSRAVELNPSMISALAACYYFMGKNDEAIASAQKYVDGFVFTGIGIVQNRNNDGNQVIAKVFEGSPAEAEGLKVGDIVGKVDGRPANGWDEKRFTQSIRGDADTDVTLRIRREGIPAPFDVTLRRKQIVAKEAALGYALKCMANREKGDSAQASENARKASEINPADPFSQQAAGALCLDKGQYAEAVKLLTPLAADSTQISMMLATAQAKLGNFKDAEDLYVGLSDDTPPQYVPGWKTRQSLLAALRPAMQKHLDRAKQFESDNQPGDAIQELSKALAIAEDKEADELRNKMFLMVQRNSIREPDEVHRHAVRGDVLLGEGNLEDAISEYNQALKLAPYSARLYFNTALVYGTLKNYPKALQYMKTYVQAAPNAPNTGAAKDAMIKWELMMEKGK